MENIWSVLGQIEFSALAVLLLWIWRKIHSLMTRPHLKPSPTIEATSAQAKQYKVALSELLKHTGAIRAYFAKFHNGDYFEDGSSIQRVSRVAEEVRQGISYESERFRGVLISTVNEETDLIVAEGPSFFVVSDMHPCNFRWQCMQGGVRAGARCAVRKGGRIVGFVGLDFESEKQSERVELLCDYARWIEGTL